MRLGEMLVRDGRLAPRQVEQALAHQAQFGGRLGTALVELKLIDPDTLTVYLGLELGIPIATPAAMERAKKSAVRLLTPQLAARCLAVPLVAQDRALIVAMRDPHDLVLLDELTAATGYRIVPRLISETRLYYYLELYYGVKRPERFAKMGDDWAVHSRDPSSLEPPAPPLPGLPPPVANPVATAPVPSPTVTTMAQAHADAQEVDYDELALELEEDTGETAGPAAGSASITNPPPVVPAPAPKVEPVNDTSILSFDQASKKMAEAGTRGQVADALIGFARGVLDVAALLVVRENMALGWRGFGKNLDRDRLETILVPLDAPSIFRGSVEHDVTYAGPAAPSALHQHLFKVLRTDTPRQSIVAPIFIGTRVVNLLYGHRDGDRWLQEGEVESIRRVTRAAAEAYVRLIARHKSSG